VRADTKEARSRVSRASMRVTTHPAVAPRGRRRDRGTEEAELDP
jgi:hypothetical protein